MNTKLIAGLGIAGMLMASAPMALAHEDGATASANASTEVHTDHGLHLGDFIGLHLGLNKAHKDNDGDADDATSTATTTRPVRPEHPEHPVRTEVRSHIVGGTVGTVSGNTFTLGGKSTTTVTIDGNTQIVSRDGATTSASIVPGAHVIAFGSTTATSTSGTSFTANVVIVFTKAWGGLRHFFHF